MDNVEQDLQELKDKSAKLKKQVSDTNKGLEKLLKKVNGKGNSESSEVPDEDMSRPRPRRT